MYEIAGWAGAAFVLIGYGLVTRYGTSLLYHALNFAGAGGLLANSLHHNALPPTALNGLWCLVAVWGIVVTRNRRTKGAR